MNKLPFIKNAFTAEKAICRIIASWFALSFLTSVGRFDFYNLSFSESMSTIASLAVMALIFVCLSCVCVLFEKYETDSFALLGFVTLCSVKWILFYISSEGKTLFSLAVLLVYCMVLFYFIMKNRHLIEKADPSKRACIIFVSACGVISFTVIAVVSCLRYKTFTSPDFDLGIFSQMFYYMKKTGLPLTTTEREGLLSHFAVHISPIFYLLLPFYAVFSSPITLQIGQAVIISSGIIPVYLLCRHYKLSSKMTMAVSFIYAFYPALSCGAFFDIHENCFLAPLLLWMILFFERENKIPMYIFAVLVLLVKEDAALYLIVFALYAILSRKRYKQGGILLASSVAYFALATFILNHFGDGVMSDRYSNLILSSDDGLFGAIKTIIQNPGYLLSQLFSTGGAKSFPSNFFFEPSKWAKVAYFVHLLFPLAMIPFMTKKMSKFLLIAPILFNMLTTYRYQYSILFQYNFAISVFLIYAMIINIPDIKRPVRTHIIAFALAACSVLYLATAAGKLIEYSALYSTQKDVYAEMEAALDTIPKEASANTSSTLSAHIWDRDVLYDITHHGNKDDVDFVAIDKRYDYEKSFNAYVSFGYETWFENDYILVMKHPDANYSK